ncbi:Sec23-binding domain of Sec16-domain-containing protein [Lasiosphaeria hispida]|uniref:Protein transport protein sec16 n=1 Tax=Lasiosphaeria hispida TaxID=260671 RepID=A0AAJ0MI35_9PEZI|nr:Sec23-binding domain of Sec16-domain-containing protein [Lasiosphaeria hispida]
MLSDAPNASWHPALRPNTTSDFPQILQPHNSPPPVNHNDREDDAGSDAGDEDVANETHNKSIGPDEWFPNYHSSNSWTEDASNPAAADEVPAQPDVADASEHRAPEVVSPTSPASKHFSTMSFTRTVPHEVNWNDDDDPEWDLNRSGTDPFKFMPPNDRTNSFPAVPPAEHPASNELEQPLAPTQAEEVVYEVEQEENHQSPGGFHADPDAFGSGFLDEEAESSNLFHQSIGGDLNGTAEETMEARFEEGMPLIPSGVDAVPGQDTAKEVNNLFGDEDAAENDSFFSKVQDSEASQPDEFLLQSPERKSTMQVLGVLNGGAANPSFSPIQETVDEDGGMPVPATHGGYGYAGPLTVEEPKEDGEDLDAKWKAMFAEDEADELDEFLPDDATETKEIDPEGFLGSDDEGFLDDAELPAAESNIPSTIVQPPSATETKAPNGRYLPGQAHTSAASAGNPYLPAAPLPGLAPANPYLPSASVPVLQPPVAAPYMTSASVPPAGARYGYTAPPLVQEQNKPQSFVDKAKGGYTSPYDLPMEVVKPKKRATVNHVQRSISTPNAPLPGPPAPPRSTSMNSPLTPTSGTFPSAVTPPGSNHSMKPLPKPLASDTKHQEKFFEELPMAKPRPASRHSNKSVPSPPQTNPYAPPSQAGPPMVPQVAPPHVAPHSSQYISDIPQLVAPARINPYGPLQPSAGLTPSIPAATPARYSPAPPIFPAVGGPVPAAPTSRYSPAPPVIRQAGAGYTPAPPVSAPPVLPHQPRTSSPLAHFEITHERSRGHALNGHHDVGLAEKRSTSSMYEARLQRVPSLPPTTEVEEEEGSLPVQTPTTGYAPGPLTASPESRYSQVPHRPKQTPPPIAYHGQGMLSPPKRATSSHGAVAPSYDFAPPPRSQTQSPGKQFGNRNGKALDPIPRPSSVHNPTSPPATAYMPATIQPVYAAVAPTTSRPRGFSQNLNYVAPTDGREQDPLQRWRGSPLISWGVGGTIVTTFPKDVPRYGMNQALPMIVRSPGEVKVQNAKDIQPMEERLAKFPGPLKGKSKKKETIAWLTTGIESLERDASSNAFAHQHVSHDAKRVTERLLLWKILRLFIEYDGALEGNPAVEKAVREILSPNPEASAAAPVYIAGAGVGRFNESRSTRLQTDAVDSSTVEQIQRHLLNGDSEKAIWAAADVRLWGHALLLANALAPNLYKQVAQEFVKKEVNFPGHNNESLAALYGVLSGNHEESVDELVPVHARAGLQLLAKDAASGPSKDAMEGLDKWRETLSLVLSNRSTSDARAIASLGTLLSGYGRAEAAHICFLFAKSQAIFGGLDDPTSNFVLVGSDHKRQAEQFAKEIEPLLLSEVYEYGQSLAGGSNVALTNPHLAAYKLQHAFALAEYGYRDKALQYCEAISTAITSQTKRSLYHHPVLEAAVEDLMARLKQAPKEESNSWIPKPSMNKVSDSVWNRFNKFVAGEDNDGSGQGSPKEGDASGPFARVAGGGTPTISRPPSTNNLETFGAAIPNYGVPAPVANGPVVSSAPPTRAASRYAPAAAYPATTESSPAYAPRSSMERTSSELNRTSSEFHRQSSELQGGYSNPYAPNMISSPTQSYTPYGAGLGLSHEIHATPQPPPAQQAPQTPTAPSAHEHVGFFPAHVNRIISSPDSKGSWSTHPQAGSYQPQAFEAPPLTPYGVPGEKENAAPDGNAEASSYEPPSFQPYGYEPPSYEPDTQPSNDDGENSEESKPKPKKKGIMYDDDDDEFSAPPKSSGGSKSKEDKDRENAEMFRKAAEEDAKRAAEAKQGKKGWGFTSWFGAGAKKEAQEVAANPNKPIRAKLGEANSFYYDPEQKRWVNKNASPGENEAKKVAPPPPKGMPRNASSSSLPPRSTNSSPAPPLGSLGPTSNPDGGRASAPPGGPPRSTMTPPPSSLGPSSDTNLPGPPMLGPPPMIRSVSNTSTASGGMPSRPPTSLSHSSSIDDLLSAAGPRKAGAKKPRKSARYVDVMTK